MTTTITLPYEDRLALAIESLVARHEARDGFLSDSDVLDATDQWTTSDLSWLSDDFVDPTDPRIDSTDRDRLRDDLFSAVME